MSHKIKSLLKNKRVLFCALLFLWFLVNLIQSAFTDVIQDEAYYYFYSQHLSFGYFDHPPLVAVMIKMSSLLFNQELSVRFMTVLLQLFTLLIIWKIIDHKESCSKDILIFFGIAGSIVMFVVYGFVTTPDSPLLFFTALFLLSYKRFLNNESIANMALLTISMAGLVYSKYQGGLVIALVILSNPKLLLNYRFWLSGLSAILLLTPHILWQIDNDFPSFKYHTIGRSKPFKISYFLEFLPNQAANFNPFALIAALYILIKFKPSEKFERALYYITAGMILFFWATTFRGHAEPQWTIAASVPIIMLIYKHSNFGFIKTVLFKLLFPSIVLLFIFRVVLLIDSIPIKLEFYNQKKWAEQVSNIAGERAVIFRDGYQRPSVYKFYTKKKAFTVNSVFYRQNQYDLHNYRAEFINRPVMIVTDANDPKALSFPILSKDSLYVRFADSLVLTSEIFINITNQLPAKLKIGDSVNVRVEVKNNSEREINLQSQEFISEMRLVLASRGKKSSYPVMHSFPKAIMQANEFYETDLTLLFPQELSPGVYSMILSIKTDPFREGFNSKPIKIELY